MPFFHDPDQHSSYVIVGGRRQGKTTQLLEWLREAKATNSYPYWDRVLLVHSTRRAQDLRIDLRREAEAKGVANSGLYYNLVYSFEEWKKACLGTGPVDIAVDDLDFLLSSYFRQTPKLVSIHGRLRVAKKPWWKKFWVGGDK